MNIYPVFRHWFDKGSVYVISDTHFDDKDRPEWLCPAEILKNINNLVTKDDVFISLGDVGKPSYIDEIDAALKILIIGNHDRRHDYEKYFDEVYTGPVFISKEILLSHEPVKGLDFCINIHGHIHSGSRIDVPECRHKNISANLIGYKPLLLKDICLDAGIHMD